MGLVLIVGLSVGHWFGVEERDAASPASTHALAPIAVEGWVQVALPLIEAEAQVGPIEQFPAVIQAEAALDTAEQRLAQAQTALTTALGYAAQDWGLPEVWQGWWCITLHRADMADVAASRQLEAPVPGGDEPWYVWVAWADARPADLSLVCQEVISRAPPSLEEQARFENVAVQHASVAFGAAVTRARMGVGSCTDQVRAARQSHADAIDETVVAIVEATRQMSGVAAEQLIRASLSGTEWAFCDGAPQLVRAAAVSVGALPARVTDELLLYWWVTRPEEYVWVCRALYEDEQAAVDRVIHAELSVGERGFCGESPGQVVTVARSMGFLASDPGEDEVIYWRVTEPGEAIRACRGAYADHRDLVARDIQAELSDAEWVFCDLNPNGLIEAAISLGFLPGRLGEESIVNWWVSHPSEYIRACKVAYELG